MRDRETPHLVEAFDYKRLILPLAGGVLISAIGFGLILLLIAWLIPPGTVWLIKHPGSANIVSTVFVALVFSLSAIIRAARRRRNITKKPPSPKQTMLQL
jgi:hypothetical protein